MTDAIASVEASPTVEGAGNSAFIIMICAVATIGGFLFGFDSGVINGTVDGLQAAFNSNSVATGFNVASMLLGCAVGAFAAGNLADIFGRKKCLLVAALLFLVSAWGSGVASGSFEFVIYRIIGGLAVGAASVMTPAYISEVAPAAYRGRLSSLQQIAIIGGLFCAFLSNYAVAQWAGSSQSEWHWGFEAWRWMFWIELLPATVFLVCLTLIPESPRYLAAQGETQGAMAVLRKLYGDDEAKVSLNAIRASLSSDHKPSIKDVFVDKTFHFKPIIWVGIGLAVFQQLVGINVIFYYGAVLWQAVGFTESDALLINVISGAVSISACVLTVFLIDKIGRKPLLLVGSAGMAVALGVMALVFTTAEVQDGQLNIGASQGVVALIAANAYVFLFNCSWGPVMWVMLGEMFPNQLRGAGLSIAGLCQWFANFCVTLSFPAMLAGLGLGLTYGSYALAAAVALAFVWYFVKETRGKTLESMT